MIPVRDSLTLAHLKMSVLVNGVAMRFPEAMKAIRRFCQPAMFHSDAPVFDAGATGSAVFIRYRGNNFGLCTLHQFGSSGVVFPPEAFFLGLDGEEGRKVGLPPNEAIQISFDHEGHQNLSDLYVARFDDTREGRNLRQHFLEIDFQATLQTVPANRVKIIVAIGFPTEEIEVNLKLDEDEIPIGYDMKLRWVRLVMERASPNKIDTPNRLPLVIHSKQENAISDPDGMSGAPVFFVYVDSSLQVYLGFAGIITNSNGHRYMIYEADTIHLLFDRAIDSDLSSAHA